MDDKDKQGYLGSRKLGFLRYEASVKVGRVIYSFEGMTKRAAERRAHNFEKDVPK
jgi:hypothetical protein